MTFVDFTKAFGTVSRDGLWKIMAKFGCPPRFHSHGPTAHDGMQARVQNDGEYSEPFPVTNGVKQCCYGTNTVQHDVFAMLKDALHVTLVFPFKYRFDGKLFVLRRM